MSWPFHLLLFILITGGLHRFNAHRVYTKRGVKEEIPSALNEWCESVFGGRGQNPWPEKSRRAVKGPLEWMPTCSPLSPSPLPFRTPFQTNLRLITASISVPSVTSSLEVRSWRMLMERRSCLYNNRWSSTTEGIFSGAYCKDLINVVYFMPDGHKTEIILIIKKN